MDNTKFTKGKWKSVKYPKTEFTTERNQVEFGNDGECVAEFVHNDYDSLLISKAPEMLVMLQKIVLMTEICKGDFNDFKERYNIEIKQLIKEATEL